MLTLRTAVHSDLTIRKSRFLGCVEPIAGRPGALVRVEELRALHSGAAHVCWALMAGGQSAANDDGEPGGTAGRPMLEVLRRQQLDGVLATVVRYFGGVKLGAGGLVRAYTDAVAQALLGAEKVELEVAVQATCELPLALEPWARRLVKTHGVTLLDADHGGTQAHLHLAGPASAMAALRTHLDAGGQGRVRWPAPGVTR
ncbi:IMPACT family protein [Ramlibacter algicola]|uniref:YigZ family protein n=1 Tax=Ramlibacter algicola TaxID=2795217 RepID=A0A934PVP2_9BURK|nr:YigZ family protein [Ramlibacter algicola]MBK0391325.1 YigZ family protein [Ramlibacter algicola]